MLRAWKGGMTLVMLSRLELKGNQVMEELPVAFLATGSLSMAVVQ